MRIKKLFAAVICLSLASVILTSCADADDVSGKSSPVSEKSDNVSKSDSNLITEATDMNMKDTVLAEIEMNDGGVIKIELYHNIAPITVENFVKLSESGYYDGLIFHRVISGFMIQGGDPLGNGTGGPGYSIKGEFSDNGVKNDISHERGVISMARRGDMYQKGDGYNTAGSQFFIMHADISSLDGQYAAFGRVTEGMDVVDKIAAVQTNSKDKPLVDQVIKTVRITDK